MKAAEAILKIRALFEDMGSYPKPEEKPEEVKIKMMEYSLADGTKVMISALEVGGDVTMADESKAPDAEHELADGTKITTVDGKITMIMPEEKVIVDAIEPTEELRQEMIQSIQSLIDENNVLSEMIKDIEVKNKQGFEMVIAMFEEFTKIPNADPIEKPAGFKFENTKDIKFERLTKYRNAILNNKN